MSFPKHLDLIERKVEEVVNKESDKIKVLAISMPPKSGKTTMAFDKIPRWFLKQYPDKKIGLSSYNAEILDINASKVKNMCVLVPIGDEACGRGFDLFIMDDYCRSIHKAGDEKFQNRICDWLKSQILTSILPGGIVIIIGSRISHKDLYVKLSNCHFIDLTTLNIAALGPIHFRDDMEDRSMGESYWPERYDSEYLYGLHDTMGEDAFEALYQGNPRIK